MRCSTARGFGIVAAVALSVSLCGCAGEKDGTMSLDGTWKFRIDSLNVGEREGWFATDTDRSEWRKVEVPEVWDRYNLSTYDGAGWFARTFEVGDSTEPMSLFFGGVDDDADVWINGVKVGSHVGYSDAFYFDVTRALRTGINQVVVRVFDHSGPGGIYKPVTLIPTANVLNLLKSPFSDQDARPSIEWVRDAVIYEVYLRSFSKEGSFQALERRLRELRDFGVTVIWLMPIHPVGEVNRKGTLGSPYSVLDYYGVNPEFGSLEDFRSLVNAVHEHGMKIIIDLVANHTAWDNNLLLENTDWYSKNEEGEIVAPNADWHDVADLNYRHHELRKYMIAMMEYWVRDVGIDGYRCDVAELVPTDFWVTARRRLDRIKPVMMLSEGTLPEHHISAFDVTYAWNTYDVLAKIIDGSTTVSVFEDILRTESLQFPRGSLRLRFNTNHDKNAWDAPAVEKFTPQGARATAVLMFTFPGVPLIYNGEEVGNPKRLDLFEKVDIDWSRNKEFQSFYRRLGELRRTHRMFTGGAYIPVRNSDGAKVYSFARSLDGEIGLVVLNLSRQPKSVSLDMSGTLAGSFQEWFTGRELSARPGEATSLTLAPFDYRVFIKHKDLP